MNHSTVHRELARLASLAAQCGGEVLLKYAGKTNRISAKGVGDWVSDADRASEDAILELLQKEAPEHNILTEETGKVIRNMESEFIWIVDPLDGTTNYLRGLPIWAVSVGLGQRTTEHDDDWGEIVAGAVFVPSLNELYYAYSDGGAWLGDQRLKLGAPRPLRDSLLATGFPFRTKHLLQPYLRLFGELLKRSADIRRPGAVAYDLCCVAKGTYDGFWELDLGPWDIAAGTIIIREAGGVVTNFDGGDDILRTGDIIAAQPGIYKDILGLVKRYFPESRKVNKFV